MVRVLFRMVYVIRFVAKMVMPGITCIILNWRMPNNIVIAIAITINNVISILNTITNPITSISATVVFSITTTMGAARDMISYQRINASCTAFFKNDDYRLEYAFGVGGPPLQTQADLKHSFVAPGRPQK